MGVARRVSSVGAFYQGPASRVSKRVAGLFVEGALASSMFLKPLPRTTAFPSG